MAERVNDFHDGNRYLQDRFDTQRLADRIASRTRDHLDEPARAFIERADMFFLATCDHRGLPTCWHCQINESSIQPLLCVAYSPL